MEATAPLTLDEPTPRRRRRRGVGLGAWLAFAPVALWLLLLVAAPTLMLVAYSFCDTDPDLGEPVWQVHARRTTASHLRAGPSGRCSWHAGVAAVIGCGILAVGVSARRIVSSWRSAGGLLLGGARYLEYCIGLGTAIRGTFFDVPGGIAFVPSGRLLAVGRAGRA